MRRPGMMLPLPLGGLTDGALRLGTPCDTFTTLCGVDGVGLTVGCIKAYWDLIKGNTLDNDTKLRDCQVANREYVLQVLRGFLPDLSKTLQYLQLRGQILRDSPRRLLLPLDNVLFMFINNLGLQVETRLRARVKNDLASFP